MNDDEIAVRLSLKDRARFSAEARAAERSVRGIGGAADHVEKRSRLASIAAGTFRGGIRLLGVAAKAGAVALGALAVGAGVAGFKMVSLATDAAETGSKFNTVFKGMNAEMDEFVATTHKDFGIPTAELQDAASTFGVFGKSAGIARKDLAGFSQDLVGAGLDLASFYNADPGEVFQNLRSGLAGEAEPMRKFGVFMSDASLNAFMLREGMEGVFSELAEGEKVAVRQAFIMDSLGDAEGDLERTSDSLANKKRALIGRFKELGTSIGTGALPLVSKLVGWLEGRLEPIVTKMSEQMPNLNRAFEVAFAEGDWQGVAEVIDNIGGNTGDLIPKVKGLVEVGKGFGSDKGGFVQGINSLKEQFPALEPMISKVQEVVGDLWKIWEKGLLPGFQLAADILPDVLQPLKLLDNALGFVADNIEWIGPLLTAFIAGWVTYKGVIFATTAPTIALTAAQQGLNIVMAMNPVGLVIAAIAGLIAILVMAWKRSETFRNVVTAVWETLKGAVSGAVNFIKDHIMTGFRVALGFATGGISEFVLFVVRNWDKIVRFFKELPGKIASAAKGMWDGIKDAFKDVINWIIRGWNSLEFRIPGFDPPGPGPRFKGFTIGVPDIPELHTGGTVTTGGMANIRPNEEYVMLPPAASVIPMESTASIPSLREAGWPEKIQVVVGRRVLGEVMLEDVKDQVARG